MLNEKVTILLLRVGLIKKILLYKWVCFPEPCTCSKNNIKVELDLSNYAIKFDLKNAAGVDTWKYAKIWFSKLKIRYW